MGLHLGWIPNEPGLRPRDFASPAPPEPAPDPAKVARLRAAQHARALWSGMLIVVGLFGLLLFGLIAVLVHARWAWPAAIALALACWLPVLLLGVNRRRAAGRLRAETVVKSREHAAELELYQQGKAQWGIAEEMRIAAAPRWLQVAAHEDISRLDVFGGTGLGRENMVTGLGWELLENRAVIVLDLSQDRVAAGLLAAAERAGMTASDYELPRDLGSTPLLAGLSGEQVASLIVEVVHADDASATAAGRATDLMILKKITGVLGADVAMGRLHAALTELLGDVAEPSGASGDEAGTPGPHGPLTAAERAGLRTLFGAGFRQQVAGNLVRLAAVVEPLTALGTDEGPRPPARLTCLSLAEGARDVATDLTAALVVQWVTRAVSTDAAGSDGARPAVILAGADEQSTRHLARLTAVCERYDIPLVRAFSRLTEESARHLDTRHTAFMRLPTRAEALRAAEHIGMERRFVAGRFAHSRSVSRSRTRTTSESVGHTSGRTEGGANTHTTGTTAGEAYSEARVPRPQQQVNINVENNQHQHQAKPAGGGREPARAAPPREREDRSSGGRGGDREGGSGRAEPRRQPGESRGGGSGGQRGGGWGGGGNSGARQRPSTSKTQISAGSGGKPQFDVVKTRTRFSAKHESDAVTKSWSATEESSHTSTTSDSRTDGVSVADEIEYELVYDHKVQPETLMTLPEDQMLAPHVTEAPPSPAAVTGPGARAAAESKMVALVIDPAAVGAEKVAPVRPHEIPAFEPPAPLVSAQVPDYEKLPRQLPKAAGEQR